MKPVNFAYERPRHLDDAIGLLAHESAHVKVLAGGQSLGPMLNLRLVQPDLIIDITALDQLKRAEKLRDYLVLGACVTHADIEDGRVPDVTNGAMRAVAAGIAYRAVRNRGTIGGSLAHADPAADWLSALALVAAQVEIWAPAGRRVVAVEDLMTGSFATVLAIDEIIAAILVPKFSPGARWGFRKFSRKAGEFAHAIGGVLNDPERQVFRAVIGAVDAAPMVFPDAERIDQEAVDELFAERGVNDPYDRQLHLAMLERAAIDASVP